MKNLTIVMYHYVRPIENSKFSGIKGLELYSFKNQLDYLCNNYSIIKAEDLINFSLGKSTLPDNACYLTFDDGYKDHIDFVMPELLKKKIQGSFFPPVNAVEKREILDVNAIHFILSETKSYKNLVSDLNKLCIDYGFTENDLSKFFSKHGLPSRWDNPLVMYVKKMLQHELPTEIRKVIISELFIKYVGIPQNEFADELYLSIPDTKKLIENGMYIGSHGCEHLHLNEQSYSKQVQEIDLSLNFLNKIGAQTNNWIMCYPYGSYNDDTLKIIKLKNCAVGLTTKPGLAKLDKKNMLELERFDTNDFPK